MELPLRKILMCTHVHIFAPGSLRNDSPQAAFNLKAGRTSSFPMKTNGKAP